MNIWNLEDWGCESQQGNASMRSTGSEEGIINLSLGSEQNSVSQNLYHVGCSGFHVLRSILSFGGGGGVLPRESTSSRLIVVKLTKESSDLPITGA